MKFGFIAHPTSIPLKRGVKFLDLAERIAREHEHGYRREFWRQRDLVPFSHMDKIVAANGASCSGTISYMPLTAKEMLKHPRRILERIIASIDAMKQSGCDLVGLGGFTAIVGNRGLVAAKRSGIPITSGNSLTAYAGYKDILTAMDALRVAPDNAEVAIVGYPGSICLALARLLLPHGCRLTLVYRGAKSREPALRDLLPAKYHRQITLTNQVAECYQRCRFYVAASSSGSLVEADRLLSGTVTVDIALPEDIIPPTRHRNDIITATGGCVNAAEQVSFGSSIIGLGLSKQLNGCLAETMVLALAGRDERFSIGRELPVAKVQEIGQLAQAHGFAPGRLICGGEPVDMERLYELRRFHGQREKARAPAGVFEAAEGDLHAQTMNRFDKHINPVMRDFFQFHHIDHVFTKAEGVKLTDANGREYLDMVAGYGCLNLGHNPPAVVAAMQEFFAHQRPNFVQYVSVPAQTARLAERLSDVAPGDLERVFFSNSGTEAVEAALKLARAATKRPRLLYLHNSYHGKTLGALSVTGREKHRKPFSPLLDHCDAIAMGDVEALSRALDQGDVAGLIVEPIQGEGGVIVPPHGFLPTAQALCRQHGALFIVDEIQTGLGRTGALFACEHEQLEPDILILAKSLSGGLIPIGATLSSAHVWDRAYGSASRFAIHTSTFGGGNLAATAGLVALETIIGEDLPQRAMDHGQLLYDGLLELAQKYPFLRQVRGKGMMMGIQFESAFRDSIAAYAKEFASRLPGNWTRMYRFLPDEAHHHMNAAIAHMEEALEDMFCMRVVSKLARDHGVLTFVTANSNNVMRIQPPLVIEPAEIAHFLAAMGQVCEDLSTFLD